MNDGTQKVATFKDAGGDIVGEMFAAANALTDGADGLSKGLYLLSETIIRGLRPENCGGGVLGGEFGYACDYENDTFMIHHYCWCEKDDCRWCSRAAPNFLYKPSGFSITWYKWIGRETKANRAITGKQWAEVFKRCYESIPHGARAKAIEEHDFDNSPEQLRLKEEGLKNVLEVMSHPEKYGCTPQTRNCDTCGKEYTYTQWGTIMAGSCDGCLRVAFGKHNK